MLDCPFCTDMSAGYTCYVCGRSNATSDFTFQWYAVEVRITAKRPVVTYHHGPRKGEKKSGGEYVCLLDSPTHYYNYAVQGIRNAEACKVIVAAQYETMAKAFQEAGYTDVKVNVFATGVTFG